MGMMMIVFAIVVAVILLAFFVAAANAKPSTPVQLADIDWDALRDERVSQYLPDQKIAAIKAYRELTGVGLAEAKHAVEVAIANPDLLNDKKARSAAQSLSDAGIRELVEDGRIDDATELYRQFTGVDEYTARDYVDGIDNELRGRG
ncbi:MAG: ribosomal protein L7/L12 [Aggregatilineales bacterium]